MNLPARFFIYAPFALFVALAIGLSAHWWIVASAFSKRLDGENGREVTPGVTLHFASKRIAGFPFRLDAIFKTLEVDVATPHGPASWRTQDFALHALTYGRDETIFEAAGRQELHWTGDDGRVQALAFVPGSLHADAIEDGRGITRFDLVVAGFGSNAFVADTAELHLRGDPSDGALDLFATAGNVRLSPRLASSFGDTIARLVVDAKFLPGKPFDALRAGHAAWPDALDGWRQAGGAMHVNQFEIAFGHTDTTGAGTVALDGVKRPTGLLDFKIAGIAHFLEHAAQTHLSGGAGKGLGAALLDRARKAGSDDMGRIGIVLGAKDGIVYVGDEPAGTVGPAY